MYVFIFKQKTAYELRSSDGSSYVCSSDLVRIVGMPLRMAGQQRKLAHQILDVMDDEGEAAVEFLETLGVVQRLLPLRLAQIAGRLPSGGAQHVEKIGRAHV